MDSLILTKYGVKRNKYPIPPIIIHFRKNTTDEQVIKEVLIKNQYQKKNIDFIINSGDKWLDLGANIGTFSILVLALGGSVVSIEPEESNIVVLKANLAPYRNYKIIEKCVSSRGGIKSFYLRPGEYNKYRHSLVRKTNTVVKLKCISFSSLLDKYPDYQYIKIDIEGEEINLLENLPDQYYDRIGKLVFEYTFDYDRSIERFYKIIDNLKKHFTIVNHPKVDREKKEYTYYPSGIMVFCIK